MKTVIHKLAAGILVGVIVQSANALEVDREVIPRMTLGGRIIGTADSMNQDSQPDTEESINLNDSALLMRFDKRMFGGGVGGAVIGLREDGELDTKTVRLHQLHLFYWGQYYGVQLGRKRLRNTLIEMPLLRDDDFISYTHTGNASSTSPDYEQLYGNILAFDWFVDKKIQRIGLWVGSRSNSGDIYDAPYGFDTMGLSYKYVQPDDLIYVKRIRNIGVLFDRQEIGSSHDHNWINSMIVGAEFNLNINPLSSWSLAFQGILNQGSDHVTAANIMNGIDTAIPARAAAKSTAFVTSLRYTGRPMLLTRWRATLNFGYKDYADVEAGSQWSVAPNLLYRIGAGVDLLGQVSYTDFGDGLGGGSDVIVRLGIVFSLEARFNDTIGERDSILNLEHGYIR